MAKAPKKQEPVEPAEDTGAHTVKHEDAIGVVDTKNDIKPPVVDIPDDDAGLVDPDDIELEEAKKAVAEESGEVAPDPGETPPAEPAPADPPPPETDPPADPPAAAAETPGEQPPDPNAKPGEGEPTRMVPQARLNEVLRSNDELASRNRYLEGVTDTHRLMMTGQPPQQNQPSQPPVETQTPEARIQVLRGGRLELATKYEAGEIALVEMRTRDDALEDEIFKVRSEALTPAPQQQPAQQSPTDLYLEERSDQIEAAHPYINKIGDQDLLFLAQRARGDLGFGNAQLMNPADLLKLRERVGVLSDQYGPIMLNETGEPPTQVQQPATPTPPAGQQPTIAQQRQQKLEAAGQHPPDITQLGQGAVPNGEPSADDIAGMTDEQIVEKLPESSRRKIMGIQ